jgi:phosphatidylglycerol:prolipoprotein diacylglycerol transferase
LIIVTITLVGAWIGAKLLFIIIYFNTIIDIFKYYQFLEALEIIVMSGYVFYGGLIGGAIALFTTLKVQKKNIFEYASIFSVVLPLGHAFGRIGCFASGCCHGIEYEGIFSYTYTEALDANTPIGVSLLPVQLIESILLFILFTILLIIYLKTNKINVIPIFYCIFYAVMRFVLEFFRGDYHRGLLFGLSTSQWISILIVLATIVTIIIYKHKKSLNKDV